jgi:hypothetical protein
MWDFFLPPALMFGWFALFRWVLPSLGVSTCLSGMCGDSAAAQWRAELDRIAMGAKAADSPPRVVNCVDLARSAPGGTEFAREAEYGPTLN